jgi:hypothetical protein
MHYSRKDLLARIKKVAKTGCWEFQGPRDAYGFGRMYSGNKEFKAHKVFYETWNGELSPGNYLHHIPPDNCIGNACCCPEHMKVTRQRR